MDQNALKKQVAEAALRYVPEGEVVGVGTGSTANFFIDGLAAMKDRITGAVASSEATAERPPAGVRGRRRRGQRTP